MIGMIKSRFDSLRNIITGKGGAGDPETGNTVGAAKVFSDDLAMTLFRGTGVARSIVKQPVDKCVRPGFTIRAKKGEEIEDILKEIKAKKMAKKLMYWNGVFGGGIMVIGAMGSGKLRDPLNLNRVKSLEFLRVYRKDEVDKTQGINEDPESPRFGMVEYYYISPAIGQPYHVHHSRVIEMDGEMVDDVTYIGNNRWGDSLYTSTWDSISRVEDVLDSVKRVMNDYSSMRVEIDGLFDAIENGAQNKILERLQLFSMARDQMNAIIHDKDETVEKMTTSVTGIDKPVQVQFDGLGIVSGIPQRMFLGKQEGGMNNKGEGEDKDLIEYLEEKREDEYMPIIDRLVEVAAAAVGETDYTIVYGDMDKQTKKEKAETMKVTSESDKNYMDTGVLFPEEVRQSRFGTEKYSLDTEIDEKYNDIPFDPTAQPTVPAAPTAPATPVEPGAE